MIRHIVMWKFREGTEEKADEFLTKLAALDGVIPQLKKCEVARNIGEGNYDAVLVSEFESMDDLNAYKVDPRHVAVSDICKSIRADRVAVVVEETEGNFRQFGECTKDGEYYGYAVLARKIGQIIHDTVEVDTSGATEPIFSKTLF